MPKETDRRAPDRPRTDRDLVHQYRSIGISAVAAAARYQRAGAGSKRPRHVQARSSTANGDASLKTVRAK